MAQKWQDFKIKELVYGKLSKNKKGSPIVYLSMLGGDLSHPRIRLNRQEVPAGGGPPTVIPVVSPFGLSLFDPDSKGRSNFDITLKRGLKLAWMTRRSRACTTRWFTATRSTANTRPNFASKST
jgi:hypothetical protein